MKDSLHRCNLGGILENSILDQISGNNREENAPDYKQTPALIFIFLKC